MASEVSPQVIAPRVARVVVAVVTGGFFFGGFDGLLTAKPAVHHQVAGLALLLVILALHLYNCVRRADGARPYAWQLTLAVQAVLTWLPMRWFESTWYGNPGFLAGAFLLLVRRRPLAWALFTLVIVADLKPALDIRHTLAESLYLVLGQTLLVGIAVYGLGRLADLVGRLDAAREQLGRLAVAAERVRFDRDLDEIVASALEAMRAAGQQALALLTAGAGGEQRAAAALARVQELAGQANSEMRAISAARRDPGQGTAIPPVSDPQVKAFAALTVTLMILPLPLREALLHHQPPATLAGFTLLLGAFTAGYLWICARVVQARRGPLFWGVLAGEAVLTYAAVPLYGPQAWCVRLYLLGLAVIALRGPLRWGVAALLLAQDVPFGVWGWGAWPESYTMVWAAERAAIVFALVRMAQLVAAVRRTEARIARVTVTAERLRFARDLHDLLGYTLSTIGLKSELAAKLITRRPERAAQEAAAALELVQQALADTASVSSGYRDLSFAEELRAVRSTLEAAGVQSFVVNDLGELPEGLDTVLATVLREAVNNILRHSSARHCVIEAVGQDGRARLRVDNDGAPEAREGSGSGLGNLGRRMESVGGGLTVTSGGGRFEVLAEAPLGRAAPAASAATA